MSLSFKSRFSFGVGHVLNDLCASMWFSYLLLYFHKVLNFSNAMAGYVLLAGQVADGLATPLVGYESDRRGNLCNYGRRKTWHLIGTIAVTLSFPPLFMRCIGCIEDTPEYAQLIYYVPLVVIFQCGWAATQINHLALLPELARDSEEKVNLNAIRYAFTVLSNILVYCVTWAIFDISGSGTEQLGDQDIDEFRNIVLVIVCIGFIFSFIFHFGVKEHNIQQRFNSYRPSESDPAISSPAEVEQNTIGEKTALLGGPNTKCNEKDAPMMKWSDWFKQPTFYQMAMLYMCTRLVVNMSQVYLPMYLTDTLNLNKRYIAIVPLVVYVSGFIATILTTPLSKFLRKEFIYILGAVMVIGACTWAHFMEEESPDTQRNIFFLAVILGLGNTIILVMCLSMLSEMVGDNTETGAFVYGAMSLTDKLSNGIAIAVIQNLNPCVCNCYLCGDFFRIIMSWYIDILVMIASLALVCFAFSRKRILVVDTATDCCNEDIVNDGEQKRSVESINTWSENPAA